MLMNAIGIVSIIGLLVLNFVLAQKMSRAHRLLRLYGGENVPTITDLFPWTRIVSVGVAVAVLVVAARMTDSSSVLVSFLGFAGYVVLVWLWVTLKRRQPYEGHSVAGTSSDLVSMSWRRYYAVVFWSSLLSLLAIDGVAIFVAMRIFVGSE